MVDDNRESLDELDNTVQDIHDDNKEGKKQEDNKKQRKRRMLIIIGAILLCVSITALFCYDAKTKLYSDSDNKLTTEKLAEKKTDEKKQLIRTAKELDQIRNDLGGYYELASDIDLTGFTWIPIGSDIEPFTGTLEGNGHIINGLMVDLNSEITCNGGLFGATNGADILDVILTNIDIHVQVSSDEHLFSNAGGIAGQINGGSIMRCSVSGSVTSRGSVEAFARAGGISGVTEQNAAIIDCYADVMVIANAESANTMAGGISGWLSNSTVDKCIFSGTITSNNTTSYVYAGGIGASGGESVVNKCVVLARRIDVSGTNMVIHPIHQYAKINNCVVVNDIKGNSPEVDNVIYVSRKEAMTMDTYKDFGWDLDTSSFSYAGISSD